MKCQISLNKNKKSYSLTVSIINPRRADLLLHGPRISMYAPRGCHTAQNMKFGCVKIQNYNTFDTAAIACSALCTVAVKKKKKSVWAAYVFQSCFFFL